MEYRRFGKTEKEISVITLGGMRYKLGWEKPVDELPDESVQNCYEITKLAIDNKINLIETANGYGKSEHLYGKVLKELPIKRDDFFLMTKGCTNSADEMKALVDKQLAALQMDHIDFYGFHGINNREIMKTALAKGGPLDALEKLKDEGVIGHIGFSTHAPLDVIMDSINSDRFEFVNLHYYYFFQKNYAAVALAKHKDMGVFIISPNDKGGQLWNASDKVKKACLPITPIQFNARFCLSHPEIHTLSFGLNEASYFDEMNGILNDDLYLDTSTRESLYTMDSFVLDAGNEHCIQCDKCLPCPEDINIPEILRFHNMLASYDMKSFGKYRYNMLESKGHWFPGNFGSNCKGSECGECLPRCPVNLDIPNLLSKTHSELFIPKQL